MEAIFNSGLVSIHTYTKGTTQRFQIEEIRVRVKWFKYKKEKVVQGLYGDYWSIEEFEEAYGDTYYIEDDVIYYRPYCDITLANSTKACKSFMTIEELDSYTAEILASNPHIIINK